MKKILVCTLMAIMVAFSIMFVPFAKAYSELNSTGASVSITPTTGQVNFAKTIVNPTTSKVEPIKVAATPENSSTQTVPWTYIAIVFFAAILITTALTFNIRKRRRVFRSRYLSAILLLSLFIALPTYGYGDVSLNVIKTKWDLSSHPLWRNLNIIIIRDSVDSSGNIWFVGHDWRQQTSKIGRLNPTTNEVTTWAPPKLGYCTAITTLTVDETDKVWFVDSFNNYTGQLDPATNFFTIWSIPGIGGASVIVSSDSMGNVYIPEYFSNKIGRINFMTNELTEWTIPTVDSGPYCVDVGADGSVWFTEYYGNKIGRLNPITNEMTEWTVPTSNSKPTGLDACGGFIYFVETSAGKIGRLNPNTNEITEWYVNGYWGSPPIGIFVDLSANVWFVSSVYLLKLGADNTLTYWGTNNEYSHGATVDTKVNIGDVYIGTYSFSGYLLAWTRTDIRRFRPTP